MADIPLSPKEFLKAKRPERFSDSLAQDAPHLDRGIVEYHLETLTSRSQETDFQTFARHLLQREVCPNLISQSGPTGGGDSKVDTETYPVSDDHSLVWFVGTGREAANERWAFAFSTKRDWLTKVKSDIAKISGTGRQYQKAFFVTSQYVKDKKRAEVEDALSKQHNLDVRIFDRTWILDRIFTGGHEDLVIDDLDFKCEMRTTVRLGPLDVQRQTELDAIEQRIKSATQGGKQSRQLADDCIEAVILARSLERPRTEVDGLLARAERVAQEYGTKHQQLIAAYQHAWTAFWHFEDHRDFIRQYAVVESLARGSENIYHVELLTNTWYLLTIVFHNGQMIKSELDTRTDSLVAELNRFASDDTQPSASLQARYMRLMVELMRTEATDPDAIFHELKAVVEQSEHLIGFPMEPLVEILTDIGQKFTESTAFDELFRTVEDVWARRGGDLAAARLQLSRGAQQLNADRPLQAIRTLGRALMRLFKDESRDELIHALGLCSTAYERMGLLWAARGSAITAAAIATQTFWKFEDVTTLQSMCYNHIKWVELQLGRIPQALAWHEIDSQVRHVLECREDNSSECDEREQSFDLILGIQFLRLDLWQLKDLGRLPASLKSMGLDGSDLALRFALGDEESVSQELRTDASQGNALRDFFIRWRDQPARNDLTTEPQLGNEQCVVLESSVAGCRLKVRCQNEHHCLSVAESLLASTESLLSTGLADRVFARQPSVLVEVRHSEFTDRPFTHKMVERNGVFEMRVLCAPFDPSRMTREQQSEAKKRLADSVMSIIAQCYFVDSVDSFIQRLFGDEQAIDRAVHFTSSFVVLESVLGKAPLSSITEWIHDDSVEVRLSRDSKWDDGVEPLGNSVEEDQDPIDIGTGRTPPGFPNPETVKHTKMQMISLIREPLWARASWVGIAVFAFEQADSPPLLCFVFQDADAAKAIFEGLRSDIGQVDSDDRLRITIVRGINRSNPYAYRVIIGAQPPKRSESGQMQMIALAARIHSMEPSSSMNLELLLSRFVSAGKYEIAPCIVSVDGKALEEPMLHLRIMKSHLNVRDAWQIGLNDLDRVGVLPDDDPIIPDAELEPPVAELLQKKQRLEVP